MRIIGRIFDHRSDRVPAAHRHGGGSGTANSISLSDISEQVEGSSPCKPVTFSGSRPHGERPTGTDEDVARISTGFVTDLSSRFDGVLNGDFTWIYLRPGVCFLSRQTEAFSPRGQHRVRRPRILLSRLAGRDRELAFLPRRARYRHRAGDNAGGLLVLRAVRGPVHADGAARDRGAADPVAGRQARRVPGDRRSRGGHHDRRRGQPALRADRGHRRPRDLQPTARGHPARAWCCSAREPRGAARRPCWTSPR